ncbi:RodZ domain-containing protein [Pediococcus argentinicus]|uniref:helix-turn-helix domain-containing protein n=1 Tax=Pediococcus argentinicus TaxID=480391 RepID=UPI00338FDE4F
MSRNKYAEIGKQLQDARQKKGWTVEDVHLKTQISKRYIMALEAGAEDDLPGEYYVQSIISQYAALVGMDPKRFNKDKEPKSVAEWREEHRPVANRIERDEVRQRPSVLMGLIRQVPWLMAMALVLVIWLLVWGLTSGMSGNAQIKADPKTVVVDHTAKKNVKSVNGKTVKPVDTSDQTAVSENGGNVDDLQVKLGSKVKTANLKVNTTDANSWIMLIDTKKVDAPVWQGSVPAKSSKSFDLEKGHSYTLQVGNVKVAKLTINNKSVPNNPKDNQIRNIKLQVK